MNVFKVNRSQEDSNKQAKYVKYNGYSVAYSAYLTHDDSNKLFIKVEIPIPDDQKLLGIYPYHTVKLDPYDSSDNFKEIGWKLDGNSFS